MPPPLTEARRAALETQLATLEAAYDAAIAGTRLASVGSVGRSVTYGPADVAALRVRIAEVKAQLGLTRRVALRPLF